MGSASHFAGTGLVTCGILVFLYAVVPHTAWLGIFATLLGLVMLFELHKGRISKEGLQPYLPKSINDFLTRTDIVEMFVTKLRENGLVSKLARLMIVKWIDLSHDEIVDVLSGVWQPFRDLSQNGTLLNLTPSWFRRVYSPKKPELTVEAEEDEFERVATYHDPTVEKLNLVPLVLWIAEGRIRAGLSTGLPMARRALLRALIPSIVIVVMWRRLPRSRKPLGALAALIFFLYVLSITRGLPAVAERLLMRMGITAFRRRNERPFRTDHRTGNVQAVLYALVEPLIPVVNVAPPEGGPKVVPNSPALSQASTHDPAGAHEGVVM